MKNYYQILGTESNATTEEIKDAYRFLANKFHPDKNPNDKISKKYFQEIQEAYECLSNRDRRKAYDAKYKAWDEGKNTNSTQTQSGANSNQPQENASSTQSQPIDKSKEIEEFQLSFKKTQKDYFVWTGILSTIVGIGLFFTRGETGLGGLVFIIPFLGFGVIYLILCLYFSPSIIAYKNGHEYKKEIFTLNCFSIFANLLTPLTFIIFFVCLLIFAQNKVKGINVLFMSIIGLFFAGMSAKRERSKKL